MALGTRTQEGIDHRVALLLAVVLAAAPLCGQASVDIAVAWSDGEPAVGVLVRLYPVGADRRGPLIARWRRTDATGIARFSGISPGTWLADGDRGGRERVEVDDNGAEACVRLPAGIRVRGKVVDTQGRAMANAQLWLSTVAATDREGVILGTTSDDGTFELTEVQPGRLLRAVSPGFAATRPTAVHGDGPITLVCDLPGRELRGHVRDDRGEPLEHALVAVELPIATRRPDWWPADLFDPRPVPMVTTDSNGAFALPGLPIETQCVWVGHQDHSIACKRVKPGTTTIEFELPRAGALRGTVRDSAGSPVAGAAVIAGSLALARQIGEGSFEWAPSRFRGNDSRAPLRPHTEGLEPLTIAPEWARWTTRTAGDGTFAFTGLPRDKGFVRARAQGVAMQRLDLSEDLNCVLQLESGRELRGTIAASSGEALPGWHVLAIPSMPDTSDWRTTVADADGRFRIDGCLPVPYDVVVRPPSTRWMRLPNDGWRLATTVPDGKPLALRLPEDPKFAFVRVHLRRADGSDLHGAALVFESPPGAEPSSQMHLAAIEQPWRGGGAACVVGPVPAGTWIISARWRDHTLPLGACRLQADDTRDLGVHMFATTQAPR